MHIVGRQSLSTKSRLSPMWRGVQSAAGAIAQTSARLSRRYEMSSKCPACGRFCGVVCRWRGDRETEVPSCVGCGLNVPHCAEETGTVKGCTRNATHKGAHRENRRERYWCAEHAPESADTLPYVDGEEPRLVTDGGRDEHRADLSPAV
jgi:hypothetical protein